MHAARHDHRRKAIAWLDAATHPAALATFDPHTAEHTRLRARQVSGQPAMGSTAYLDLAMSVGPERQQRTVRGVVVTRDPATDGNLKAFCWSMHRLSPSKPGARIPSSSPSHRLCVRWEAPRRSRSPGSTSAVTRATGRSLSHFLNRDVPGGYRPETRLDLRQWWAKGKNATAEDGTEIARRHRGLSFPLVQTSDQIAGPLRTVAAGLAGRPHGQRWELPRPK